MDKIQVYYSVSLKLFVLRYSRKKAADALKDRIYLIYINTPVIPIRSLLKD
jgi:hypothetical protein